MTNNHIKTIIGYFSLTYKKFKNSEVIKNTLLEIVRIKIEILSKKIV